jgi:large subunit ribosomal protein L10
MASAKILEQKKAVVAELEQKLQNASAGVLVSYEGISVEEDTKLRKELREAGVEYSVVKNTLVRLALDAAGMQELDGVLHGTTALALAGEDQIAPARIICKFAKKHETFKVKAGFMDGKVMSVDEVNAIANLPSREQLLGQLLSVLNGNLSGLARALNAIAEQKGGASEEAAE